MAEPDLLELFRKHAQDGQKEMVSLFCNDVRRLSRTKKIKRLLVLGRYAGNSELCGHVLRVLEMLPELPGMACPAYLLVDGLVRIGFQCFFNVLFRQVFLVGSGVIFLQTDNIGVAIYKIR